MKPWVGKDYISLPILFGQMNEQYGCYPLLKLPFQITLKNEANLRGRVRTLPFGEYEIVSLKITKGEYH